MTGVSRASGQSDPLNSVAGFEPSLIDPAKYPCRRPIEAWEVESLRTLGREVRAIRFHQGKLAIRAGKLGRAAQVPGTTLWRIETGVRRTRRSTLQRLAKATARLNPSAGTQGEILARLIEAAGSALAPPSKYQYRVDRRRMSRFRRSNANPYLRELSGLSPSDPER